MDPSSLPAAPPHLVRARLKTLPLAEGPYMVGILNVTPDSFYDGGRHAGLAAALAQARQLIAEGAAIIDIGGQSTRPGHAEVTVAEEIARVVPVIEALVGTVTVPLAIDTYKPAVARAALAAGADLLNDVHGFQRHPELARLAAEFGCGVILMHQEAGFAATARAPLPRIAEFFRRSLAVAASAGVRPDGLILDPGIGFAKTPAQNLEILGGLGELAALGHPLLLGASRKSVIDHVLALPPAERLEGTLATTALAVWQGVDFIRVHDVRANLRAARMARAIRAARPTPP